jgi:hypothetical protein
MADGLAFNSEPDHRAHPPRSNDFNMGWGANFLTPEFRLNQRQSHTDTSLRSTIGDTTGCPTEARVALVGIATDCSYTASFDSIEALRQNILNVVNTASGTYERTFNISISLQNLTISDAECPRRAPTSTPWNVPCSDAGVDRRLDLFSSWRGLRDDDNAYWTLLSACSTGGSVGLASIGQACVSGSNDKGSPSLSGANVVVRSPWEWEAFA